MEHNAMIRKTYLYFEECVYMERNQLMLHLAHILFKWLFHFLIHDPVSPVKYLIS